MASWRDACTGFAALLGLVAISLLAAGPVGWRFGWWHYGFAFRTLMPWAAWVGIAAIVVSVPALILALRGTMRQRMFAVIGLAAGFIAFWMPWQAGSQRGLYPPINDITTDMLDPPSFVVALPLRKADGGNSAGYDPSFAALQRSAYPDIEPLRTDLAPADAFARAADAAATMPGWRIIARDAESGRVEASDTSRWFGFTDDVVIRVAADGSGSRIDVRSASRHGRGDFGVNAARIRAFVAALEPRLKQAGRRPGNDDSKTK